jgi:hypothetical protein
MKNVKISFFLLLLFSLFFGCSKSDNSTNPTGSLGNLGGGLGTGGGNTGNVTVTVSLVQDNQQQYYFEFTPSVAVYMTQIVGNCAAAGVTNENVPVNLTSDATNPIDVGPITGLQSGQQWTFTISGNVGDQQGAAFTSTANYTIQ